MQIIKRAVYWAMPKLKENRAKSDRRAFKIGCGRGGGSRYISRNYQPLEMVGLDLSAENIKTCKRLVKDPKLTYVEGDAENLPFPGQSFDIVVNVESSHDYPSFIRFLGEVRRVLKKGGYFLIADYRTELGMLQMKADLNRDWHLGLVSYKDITLNVVEALRQNTPLVEESIRKHIQNPDHANFFRKWVRAEGSTGFNRFRDRLEVYASFVYRSDVD